MTLIIALRRRRGRRSRVVLSMMLTRILYICQPNEVLVFSGGQRASVGRKVGYRVIQGGRGAAHPADRDRRLDGPDEHADRAARAGRVLEGRHPASTCTASPT